MLIVVKTSKLKIGIFRPLKLINTSTVIQTRTDQLMIGSFFLYALRQPMDK